MVDSLKDYVTIAVGVASVFALTGQGFNSWYDFSIKIKKRHKHHKRKHRN
ncbi:hypothetical protein [Limosilactobacillus reuteri]|nr:hypothetical protein [Limosilactobacillus reuteri]MBW3350580.1 hypothetical protein [Limosilactobacillus reuteri]UUW69623.1 hypothetical protein NUJ10_11330 [Limosilactobacillus reuteri]